MTNISDTQVDRINSFVRIIVEEQTISLDKFEWHDDELESWITLEEISNRLNQLGFQGVYYVWEDTPLRGTIYQYGNYLPLEWMVYGNTMGFA